MTQNPDEIFNNPAVEAVVIATETSTHADLCIRAINANKHVLLEKPIAPTIEQARPVVEAAEAAPHLKVMIGFVRRFDQSYQEAVQRIQDGQVGRPYIVRATTNDTLDRSGFIVQYCRTSGGIWLDGAIHDIDLARWILDVDNSKALDNPKKQVNKVYATGMTVAHPEMREFNDVDNGLGIVEFANGTQGVFHISRTSIFGHECYMEIYGEKSKLNINGNPNMSRVEIRDEHGVRMESHQSWLDRLEPAFRREMIAFADMVLDDKSIPISARSAMEASQIAVALTHSVQRGVPIHFDDQGEPILN